jgi:hypothetical protein
MTMPCLTLPSSPSSFGETYMAVIPNPPYFPDLAPYDIPVFLFPKMKLKLKGCWFDTTEQIQADRREYLTL